MHPELKKDKVETSIDAGACHGANLESFMRNFKNLRSIVLLEPEIANFQKLKYKVECIKDSIKLTPLKNGAWSSNTTLHLKVSDSHPGAHTISTPIEEKSNHIQIETLTIDNIQGNLDKKIDFIKMDIEGAEIEAIYGATDTIKKYKPQLAICVYHYLDDLWKIPVLVNSIRDDYSFYLGHHSDNHWETVLYCV